MCIILQFAALLRFATVLRDAATMLISGAVAEQTAEWAGWQGSSGQQQGGGGRAAAVAESRQWQGSRAEWQSSSGSHKVATGSPLGRHYDSAARSV